MGHELGVRIPDYYFWQVAIWFPEDPTEGAAAWSSTAIPQVGGTVEMEPQATSSYLCSVIKQLLLFRRPGC